MRKVHEGVGEYSGPVQAMFENVQSAPNLYSTMANAEATGIGDFEKRNADRGFSSFTDIGFSVPRMLFFNKKNIYAIYYLYNIIMLNGLTFAFGKIVHL